MTDMLKSFLRKNSKEITHYVSHSTSGKRIPMSTILEKDAHPSFDDTYFQHNLPNYYRNALKKFRKASSSFVNFNIIFSALIAAEVTLFVFFLPFLSRSAFLAFALGGLFLTCFSYIVLLFYHQAKKPEQFSEIKEDFLRSCRQLLPLPPGVAQHHLSIAEVATKFSHYLQDYELNFYKIPSPLQFLAPTIERFSSYCYREDVFKMKQLLLEAAVDEHLKQIRSTPTDLEVHASLATSYVYLSRLYRESSSKKISDSSPEKFTIYSRLAIEEFKILSQYAPNDPWIHDQLAQGYKDLGMPEEEIKEVEILFKLRPQDKEILFRLGLLYFEQGSNAKGLQIYEELKKANYKKAEDLISSYGTFA